jgi:hypothetical protein
VRARRLLTGWLLAQLALQLLAALLQPSSAAPPPYSPAPPWYDDSIPPGYIALWKGGTRTLMPFYGWVPSGYDFWVVRAVTSLPKLAATVTVDSTKDAVLTPWIYDAAFSWSGGGVPAYALPVTLNKGWNLVFLRKGSQPSASGMWATVTAADWSQIRFGDSTGLPGGFLTHSVIWSNSTHAQVLVYAPQPGTYYLYWQSQVQVPDAGAPHPFYACYGGVCGVRFNGINQCAQSWVAKNWLPTNASSIVWQFYVFPNQTDVVPLVSVDTNTQYLTVLQGRIATDPTTGWNVLYLPASISGYVAAVELPSMSGITQFTTFARGSASASGVLRYELYEDGRLIYSGYRGVTTSYTWAEFGAWLLNASRKYVVKVWFAGGVDVYLRWIVIVMHRLGAAGFRWNDVSFILLDKVPNANAAAVWYYVYDSGAVLHTMWVGQSLQGRLLTATATVNSTRRALYVNATLKFSESYTYGLRQAASYFVVGAGWWYFYGLTTKALAYNRSLAAEEVAAVHSGSVPSGGLLFYLVADPRYLYDLNWDGYVDWQDLSGNGNHMSLVNFHSRGSFTGAVYSVSAYFPPLSQPSFSVSYRSGGGRLVVSRVPFGAQLTVKDPSGNIVYSGVGQGLPAALSLPAGAYTVELSSAGSALTGVAAQPYSVLRAQVSVGSGSGATVAPHLYAWYFTGGYLYAPSSASLNITGAFTLTTAVRDLFTRSTTVASKRYYVQTLEAAAPAPACAGRDSYGIKVDSQGRAYAVMTSGAGTTYTAADSANLGDLSNGRLVWLAARYDGSYLTVYRNGTATSASAGSATLETCPSGFAVAWDASGNSAYGRISYVALHAAAVDPSQVAASFAVPASSLVLFSDPTFWDGSRYVDLSGSGNHLYPVGSVSRVEDSSKWLWVVQGLGPAGAVAFRFMPAGALVRVLDPSGNPVYQLASDGGDATVSLPAGTYTVEVWLPGGGAGAPAVQTFSWGDEVYGMGAGFLSAQVAPVPSAAACGWVQGRLRRRELPIQGSGAGPLSNYLVPVLVAKRQEYASATNALYCPSCSDDFGDVVFTMADGSTQLPVWLEQSQPGAWALFWVQVPSLPASPSSASVYAYYGLAPSGSPAPRPLPKAPLIEGFEGYAEGAYVPSRGGAGEARVYSVAGGKALRIYSPANATTVIASAAAGGRVVARVWVNASAFYVGWCDGQTFAADGRPLKGLLAWFNLTAGSTTLLYDLKPVAAKGSAPPGMSWARVEIRWWAGYAHLVVSADAVSQPLVAAWTISAPPANYSWLALGVWGPGAAYVDYVALLPGVVPDVYPVGFGSEEVMSGVSMQPPPLGLPAAAPKVDPIPALGAALRDPYAGTLMSTALVVAVAIAAARIEASLPRAIALAGAVLAAVGIHVGNYAMVGVGAAALVFALALAVA